MLNNFRDNLNKRHRFLFRARCVVIKYVGAFKVLIDHGPLCMCSYKLVVPADEKFGAVDVSGNWNGIVQMLMMKVWSRQSYIAGIGIHSE